MKGNDTNKPPNDKKNGKPAIKSSRIDHTYYDHSTRPLSEFIDVDEKRSKRISFPMKLHAILSKVEYRHIICWMPHGRSWKVVDKDLLVSIVCKENFSHESFGSFNRSVNGWGFKRLMSPGPDHKTYYHELFLRGRADLAQVMTRLVNPGKRLPDAQGEPNFYKIAEMFPLPEDPNASNEVVASNQILKSSADGTKESKPVSAYADVLEARSFSHDNPAHRPPSKRQKRNSYPPESYSYPLAPHHGHHPGYSHSNAAQGCGHYQYPIGTYSHRASSEHQHLHNPYISPERPYDFTQRHWQGHHSYNMHTGYCGSQYYHHHQSANRANSDEGLYYTQLATEACCRKSNTHSRPPVIHRFESAAPTSESFAQESHSQYASFKSESRTSSSSLLSDFFKDEWPDHTAKLQKQKTSKFIISATGIKPEKDFMPIGSASQIDNTKPAVSAPETTRSPIESNLRVERADSMSEVYDLLMKDDGEEPRNKEANQD